MDESKAQRADVPAMLRASGCVRYFMPLDDRELGRIYQPVEICALLADTLAAADAMRGGSVVVTCGEWARLCEAYDAARAALAKALEGGEGC